MSQAVPKGCTVAAVLNVAPSDGVGIPAAHSRHDRRRGESVSLADDLVHLAMSVVGVPNEERARDVGAITVHDGAKIDEQPFVLTDEPGGGARVGKRRATTGGDDGRKGKGFTARIAQRVLQHAGDRKLGHAGGYPRHRLA